VSLARDVEQQGVSPLLRLETVVVYWFWCAMVMKSSNGRQTREAYVCRSLRVHSFPGLSAKTGRAKQSKTGEA